MNVKLALFTFLIQISSLNCEQYLFILLFLYNIYLIVQSVPNG